MHYSLSSYATILGAIATTCKASFDVGASFKLDVHSHVIPDSWYTALIEEGGYPVVDGTLFVDDFPVESTWNLSTHLAAMNTNGINYSTIHVSSPGVTWLANNATRAVSLAKEINDDMASYVAAYPDRLGAMCLLPLPHINESISMISYCLDHLNFVGIGMYTNFNGIYLGDAILDPVFANLNGRGNVTIFVHPTEPGCSSITLGRPAPMIEYPFESVRAMENMLLSGQRANYSDINIIFPHGGGALPYLGARIAGLASLPFVGALSVLDSLAQFKEYYFDTASATSAAQLLAMTAFSGVTKIVTGTDYPYVPEVQALPALKSIQVNGGFNDSVQALINSQNALSIFPRVVAILNLTNTSSASNITTSTTTNSPNSSWASTTTVGSIGGMSFMQTSLIGFMALLLLDYCKLF